MPPYPLTPSKGMLTLDDVDRPNKRQKLEENYMSVNGISSLFSLKQIAADELHSYEWTSFEEESINFQMGKEEISAVGSTENKDAVFITDADMFGFQETSSEENTMHSWDLIDNDCSLEITKEIPDSTSLEEISAVGSTENKNTVVIIDADVFGFKETPSEEDTIHSRDLIDNDCSLEITKEIPDPTSLEESADVDIQWLDYVAQYNAEGQKCRKEDIPTRKLEIIDELQMISETVRQMKEDERDESSLFKYQKKVVQKIKVDCPNCQKKVAAIRFIPHLSKCFGNGGRKCTRQRLSP